MTKGGSDASSRRPRLTDGRVVLRPWTQADAQFLAEASADPAIRQYNGDHDRHGKPDPLQSLDQIEFRVAGFARNLDAHANGGTPAGVAFVIEDEARQAVGCCGVDDWTGEDVAQIGYWLTAAGRGRGYATRAVVLLTGWLFELGAARVFLTVVAGNEGSAAVARRAGFAYEGTMRSHAVWQGRRHDVWWFGVLPSEWPPNHAAKDRG